MSSTSKAIGQALAREAHAVLDDMRPQNFGRSVYVASAVVVVTVSVLDAAARRLLFHLTHRKDQP